MNGARIQAPCSGVIHTIREQKRELRVRIHTLNSDSLILLLLLLFLFCILFCWSVALSIPYNPCRCVLSDWAAYYVYSRSLTHWSLSLMQVCVYLCDDCWYVNIFVYVSVCTWNFQCDFLELFFLLKCPLNFWSFYSLFFLLSKLHRFKSLFCYIFLPINYELLTFPLDRNFYLHRKFT